MLLKSRGLKSPAEQFTVGLQSSTCACCNSHFFILEIAIVDCVLKVHVAHLLCVCWTPHGTLVTGTHCDGKAPSTTAPEEHVEPPITALQYSTGTLITEHFSPLKSPSVTAPEEPVERFTVGLQSSTSAGCNGTFRGSGNSPVIHCS